VDNTNPERFNVEQEKIWLISRIELYHKAIIEEFNARIQLFDSVTEKEITRVKGRRNNILTGLGFALTIIFGINVVWQIEQIYFFEFLIGILLIGLTTFIVFNYIMIKEENIFNLIAKSVLEYSGHISYSLGFIINKTAVLNAINYSYLYNYFLFMQLLNAAIIVGGFNVLKKCKEEKFLNPDIKKELEIDKESFDLVIKNIPDCAKQFDRSQELPKKLLDFIDKELVDYLKKTSNQKKE